MSEPKLHHYVPQFYLQHFTDSQGLLNVWDKRTQAVFRATTRVVGAQTHFYRVPELIGTEHDPLFLERELAHLEGEVACTLREVFVQLHKAGPMERIEQTQEQRWQLSSFIAIQFLRSAEQREVLKLFAESLGLYEGPISVDEAINLHTRMLAKVGGLVEKLTKHLFDSIWLFARNTSSVPFWSSDAPVCFKTGDNRMWLKGPGIFAEGVYVVFPVSPTYMLYCKERSYWSAIARIDSCVSPVELTAEMVEHENAGQVFMATRHVVSPTNDFRFANEFVATIGKDREA